jgi:uncharacterized protein YbaR (Trm112 family)
MPRGLTSTSSVEWPRGGSLFLEKGVETMAISQELLDILACPKCKGDIYLNETKDGLICDACKLLYEIRDDIPIMLIDEAKPIAD